MLAWWEDLVRERKLLTLVRTGFHCSSDAVPYLHSSSHSVDTVVGDLWWQTLQCLLDNIVLLTDEIVGTVFEILSINPSDSVP